jgi:hypothetical protein
LELAIAVRIKSTNPATIPSTSPTTESQDVCNQRSNPTPTSQPTTVAAGNTNASWLICPACTQKLFFGGSFSGKETSEDHPNFNDQFTACMKCSGKIPMMTVARAVTPRATFIPRLIESRSLFTASRMNIALATRR